MPDADDQRYMRRALELAARGEGHVEPNPMVGCVVVAKGQTGADSVAGDLADEIVGEGWHRSFGQAHAEVNALAAAGERARGATLYVTLEPCCHTGKTPPCSGAVILAGIARVVVAARDPFPAVDGGGVAELQAAGITVDLGVEQAAALALLAPYRKRLATGRPWVIAKWAMTLDGKIAARDGSSQWISSPESRAVVHAIRGRVDAIVVGRGTAEADDPLLTARPAGPRRAARVVLGAPTAESRLVRTIDQAPLLVFVRDAAAQHEAGWLTAAGAEVLVAAGPTDRDRFAAMLDELGRRQMTNVLVEGGAGVLGVALDAQEINEAHVFVAPKIVGGADATTAIGGGGLPSMADALPLADPVVQQLGGDVYVRGLVTPRPVL